MEPQCAWRRHTRMLADTSDILALSVAQRRHADDLIAVSAELAEARMPADAFGSLGSAFLAALNDALMQQANRVAQLAERLVAATATTGAAADAYQTTEHVVGQSISLLGA
jgi:hypothetical protein